MRLCQAQEPLRRIEATCLKAQLRRSERALGSSISVGCQREGALQERGCGADAPSRLRATRASFELLCDRLVGSRDGRRQVPCPTVRIDRPIGGICQCNMHGPALVRRRRAVDRGADERMPEPRGPVDRQQTIRGVGRGDVDPELVGRTTDEHRIAHRLGGSDEQQEPRISRDRLDAAAKAFLELRRQRSLRSVQEPEATGKLLHGQATRQLE
jgi:hypothetical protein